jgi:hypothetical protein
MKKYKGLLLVACGAYVACALGQEFIKSPKVKKVYVSCQQYLELEADLISSTNSIMGLCADLLKTAFLVQKGSLDTINEHVDGEKESFLQQADKNERTDKYAKLMKLKQEWDAAIDQLRGIKERLERAIAAFCA